MVEMRNAVARADAMRAGENMKEARTNTGVANKEVMVEDNKADMVVRNRVAAMRVAATKVESKMAASKVDTVEGNKTTDLKAAIPTVVDALVAETFLKAESEAPKQELHIRVLTELSKAMVEAEAMAVMMI